MDILGNLIELISQIWLIALIARVVLSWINHDPYHPVARFLGRVTDPILLPIQRILPSIAGLDFSPVIALFLVRYGGEWLANFVRGLG